LGAVGAPRRELPRGGSLYLVAVGIEKPGNLGAMARSADAAGADALLVAEAEADPWNPNAIRASTGAVFTLPVVEATLDEVRGLAVRLVAAAVDAPTRYTDADLAAAVAFAAAARAAPPPPAGRGPRAARPGGPAPARGSPRRQPERGARSRDPSFRSGPSTRLTGPAIARPGNGSSRIAAAILARR